MTMKHRRKRASESGMCWNGYFTVLLLEKVPQYPLWLVCEVKNSHLASFYLIFRGTWNTIKIPFFAIVLLTFLYLLVVLSICQSWNMELQRMSDLQWGWITSSRCNHSRTPSFLMFQLFSNYFIFPRTSIWSLRFFLQQRLIQNKYRVLTVVHCDGGSPEGRSWDRYCLTCNQ